jgi:hypothetical protein
MTERKPDADKMPTGRPTKFEGSYCQAVIAAGELGYSLTSFAGQIGVARSTINEWMDHFPEFSEAVKQHKAKRSLWWEDRLRAIAQEGGGPGAVTAVIFGLKNVAPEDFADRVVNEHTGKDGGPIQTERKPDLSDLDPDERDAIRAILGRRAKEPGSGAS